ncbi:MAG: 30S ribosomal protein S21 [Candidatus Moranbacteria bacterium]|nr:30S ribosomal protein S21 [Candidatus Moranbacteria bacterium]
MVEVKNKGNEAVENLLRKFNRRWQQSGIGKRNRNRRYHKKPMNRRTRRQRALHRLMLLEKKERLIKMGRLEEEKNRFMTGKLGKR